MPMKLKLFEIVVVQQTKLVIRVGAFDRLDAENRWKGTNENTVVSTEDYGMRIIEDWKEIKP